MQKKDNLPDLPTFGIPNTANRTRCTGVLSSVFIIIWKWIIFVDFSFNKYVFIEQCSKFLSEVSSFFFSHHYLLHLLSEENIEKMKRNKMSQKINVILLDIWKRRQTKTMKKYESHFSHSSSSRFTGWNNLFWYTKQRQIFFLLFSMFQFNFIFERACLPLTINNSLDVR